MIFMLAQITTTLNKCKYSKSVPPSYDHTIIVELIFCTLYFVLCIIAINENIKLSLEKFPLYIIRIYTCITCVSYNYWYL